MGLFKTKEERQLDSIILTMQMNMSNNYKDNAQADFHDLEELLTEYNQQGLLTGRKYKKYEAIMIEYKEKMKGFTHKDQKPFWT